MVMARVLVKEDLAAYRQTFLAYLAVAPLITMGIGQGMFYFVPVEEKRIRGRVFDGMLVAGIFGVLFALFILFGGNELLAARFDNPKVAHLLLWLIPYTIVTTPADLTNSVLVARDRAQLAAVFGVVKQLAIGLSAIVPLIIWETAESSLIGNVTASIMMGLVGCLLIFRNTPTEWASPHIDGIKELLRFSAPLSLAGMFGTLSLQLDKIIVSLMCSPAEFAVYSLGAIEIPLIGIVTGATTSVMLVDMRRAIDKGDKAEALRLFRMIAEKTSLVLFPAMVFLMLMADTLMVYLFSSEYVESAVPFRIYLLLLPVRTVLFGSLLMALGKSRFILFRTVVGFFINLTLSTFMVWNFGSPGAVVATILTVYIWVTPAHFFVIRSELKVRYRDILPLRNMSVTALALFPLGLLGLLIRSTVGGMHLQFALVVLSFSIFVGVYWHGRLYTFDRLKAQFA